MQATIIAVGSELLVGQITNRNAAWVSAKLFALGIRTQRHVTVDDVASEIIDALTDAAAATDIIIVTGGLGPTSDDLTRNAVASWAGAALTWHEPSWTRIVAFFTGLGRTTPESNRQQCYFPADATIIENHAGTANAFSLKVRGKSVWVLPGPPREVEAVWDAHVGRTLAALVPATERSIYRMWRTIGRGESDIAEQVEELIKGHGLDVAYRAHPPFVETKLRFAAKDQEKYAALCERLNDTLAPWIFEVDDEDSTRAFVAWLATQRRRVRIVDALTRGHLVELLSPLWRERKDDKPDLTIETAWGLGARARPEGDELVLSVGPGRSPETWLLGAATTSSDAEQEYANAFKGAALQSRNVKAIASWALKRWPELLA